MARFRDALNMTSVDKITNSDVPESTKEELITKIYDLTPFVEAFEQEYAQLVLDHTYYPKFRKNLGKFSPTPLPEPAPAKTNNRAPTEQNTAMVNTSKPSAIHHIDDNDRLKNDLENAKFEAERIQKERRDMMQQRPGIAHDADKDHKERTRQALLQQEEEERRIQSLRNQKMMDNQQKADPVASHHQPQHVQTSNNPQQEMKERQEREAREIAMRQQREREAKERLAREALDREM